MVRVPRSMLVLLLPLALLLALLPAALLPGPAVSSTPGGSSPGTYTNPLAPRVPRDGTVDSCADPTVVRGHGAQRRTWFMFCTTDPLNDDETRSGPAQTTFHPVPMLRSHDLTHWSYVGDAFDDERPSWATPTAALWAPDVVWSRTFHRWYMTFVVTDTTDAVSGEPGCKTDSAIGVATSRRATGPWHVSDTPVVAPRRAGESCSFLWTYDPDVLGNRVRRNGVLYFGSYYGGVFGQHVRLTRHGMTTTGRRTKVALGQHRRPGVPASSRMPRTRAEARAAAQAPAEAQVSIANRYEGANVVRHGRWFYMFASATNCCNGPLTGYSVFAGRSRSPLGPFVDREGNSFLAGRVGGTPVISMNGNRWVGTGHSSAFVDRGGQWWLAYHAVDRHDPYFAGQTGFTKRPVLLDPLDWVDGWPTVRAGRWASNKTMPAPAAQRGQRTAYRPRPPAPHRPGRLRAAFSDTFDGSTLDPRWSWVGPPAASGYAVEDGGLRFDTEDADLNTDENSASVLTEKAPRGDYVAQTKVALDVPPEGCCQDFVQAGLVVYGSDDAFVKLAHVSVFETRQTEWATEVPEAPEGFPRYGNTVVGPPADDTWLRIVRRGHRFTAYTSQDGHAWVRGGTWVNRSIGPDARLGLVSMGGAGFTARFDDVVVRSLRR